MALLGDLKSLYDSASWGMQDRIDSILAGRRDNYIENAGGQPSDAARQIYARAWLDGTIKDDWGSNRILGGLLSAGNIAKTQEALATEQIARDKQAREAEYLRQVQAGQNAVPATNDSFGRDNPEAIASEQAAAAKAAANNWRNSGSTFDSINSYINGLSVNDSEKARLKQDLLYDSKTESGAIEGLQNVIQNRQEDSAADARNAELRNIKAEAEKGLLSTHAEGQSYINAALNSPTKLASIFDAYEKTPTKVDDALADWMRADPTSAVTAIGMQMVRSQGGPDAGMFEDNNFWNSVFGSNGWGSALTDVANKYGLNTPEAQKAAANWAATMSPAAQSARNDPDEGFLGDLTPLVGIAAAAFGQPYLAGALGGGLGGALGAGALIGGGTSALTGGDVLKGALLGGVGGGLSYGAGGLFGDTGYVDTLGGMTDATGTALPGWSEMAQTFPVIDYQQGITQTPLDQVASLPQNQVGALTNAGGNMDWTDTLGGLFDEGVGAIRTDPFSTVDYGALAAQDFADFGVTGVESLGDALNYSTGAADFTAGISSATQAADFLRNLGLDTNTALNLVSKAGSLGLSPANAIKAIVGGSTGAGGISGTGLLAGGANILGGVLQGNSAKEAAQIQANAQLEAARIAAEAAKFKPVGVTTRFGQSQFGYDDKGNLTSAGYNLSPEMKAQQDALMATSGGLLNQFQGAQAATAPLGTAAQRAMQLGQGYLATDPAAQAQKYMAEQQALLAPTRERQMASTLQGEFNRGTYGLGTGSTSTGMMSANPRLEALMNAQRQQDLQLASQATQGGMDYAKFGTTMTGAGSDLLKSMYGTQAAAYAPYQTALGGAQTIEGLGQNAMTLGTGLGSSVTAANAAQGSLLGSGIANAAATQAQANAYSPWATALTNAGGMLNKYAQPQQPIYNIYTQPSLG